MDQTVGRRQRYRCQGGGDECQASDFGIGAHVVRIKQAAEKWYDINSDGHPPPPPSAASQSMSLYGKSPR